MGLHNVYDKLHRSDMPDTGTIFYIPGLDAHVVAWGTTVPTDATAGYAPGGFFFDTNASIVGGAPYINTGSETSCAFKQMVSAKVGAEGAPLTTATADVKHFNWYLGTTATSGDNRGLYMWYYIGSTGGGECLRAKTILLTAATVDAAHGAHISLEHQGSGHCTGLGVACRSTMEIAEDVNPTGTLSALMGEVWYNGTTSSADITAAAHSCLRLNIGGDATAAARQTTWIAFDGTTAASNSNMVVTGTVGGTAKGLRISIDGVPHYIAIGTTCS